MHILSHTKGATETLGSTATYHIPPPGANGLILGSTGAFEWNFTERIHRVLKDISDTVTDITSVVESAKAGTTATAVTLNSMASTDEVYIGCDRPFRALYVDVTDTNSTASVMTVKYWNGTAWADITATDNTVTDSKTLAKDGTITWTVPTTWATTTVSGRGPHFWVQITVSVALDATVSLVRLLALKEDSVLAEQRAGVAGDWPIYYNRNYVGGIEVSAATGTPTLDVTWVRGSGSY